MMLCVTIIFGINGPFTKALLGGGLTPYTVSYTHLDVYKRQALGWCTFDGDHMSMYAVNSGITKTSVQLIVGWYATHKAGDTPLATTLQDIVATPISPELLPIKDTKAGSEQQTQSLVGPYELNDFFIYHLSLIHI